MAGVVAPRLCRLQTVLASSTLHPPPASSSRLAVVCAAASRGRSRASSSAAGSGPPPAAAAAAAGQPPAAAEEGPLSQARRRVLAEKLTEVARNIAWLDARKDWPQEATREQIAALEERLVRRGRAGASI